MITRNIEIEELLEYRISGDGELIGAPCGCYGDDHNGHPYCSEPTDELLQAERDGKIYRQLNTGWRWFVA